MKNRFPSLSLSAYGSGWSSGRRVAVVGGVLACLIMMTATIAYFTGGRQQPDRADTTTPAASSPAAERPPSPSAGTGSVPKPPPVAEPLSYAKAAAAMLWSYDTRRTSHDQQLAGMKQWMTPEAEFADWASVSGQVPDPVLWSRMADNRQHATPSVAEAHFPSAFKAALADSPEAITEAYIYAVTVSGSQQIAWKQDGGGAEDRSVTLAVQCRPSRDCSLVAIAPRVAP